MVYTVILLIVFLLVLLIRSPKCRFTIYFVSIAISFVMMFFSNIMFITKFGNYGTPSLNLFTLDYSLYIFLFKYELSYIAMENMFNIGASIYIFMTVIFADKYINVELQKKITVDKIKKCLIYLILPVFNIIFYSSVVGTELYFIYNSITLQWEKDLMQNIIIGMDYLKYILLCIYLFYPVKKLNDYSKKIKLTYVKKQITGIKACLVLLNIVGMVLLIVSPVGRVYFRDFPNSLLISTATINFPFKYYSLIFFGMFGIVMAMIYLLFHYRSLDTVDFFRELSIRKNMKKLNENVRGTYHSLKTHMFTINILAKKAEEQYGEAEGLETIQRIQDLTQKNIENITSMLNSFKDTKLNFKKQNISQIITSAVAITQFNSIKVNLLLGEDVEAFCDFYNICECVVNLLKNSIEAINQSDNEGIITIETYNEVEWSVIKITDNGVGIDKAQAKKIFRPFYSTKSKQSNFGIGLSYVYKIVNKHNGILYFESNGTTSFYLCLRMVE